MPGWVQPCYLFGTKRGFSFASLRAYSDCFYNQMTWLLYFNWQDYELINQSDANQLNDAAPPLWCCMITLLANRLAILPGQEEDYPTVESVCVSLLVVVIGIELATRWRKKRWVLVINNKRRDECHFNKSINFKFSEKIRRPLSWPLEYTSVILRNKNKAFWLAHLNQNTTDTRMRRLNPSKPAWFEWN